MPPRPLRYATAKQVALARNKAHQFAAAHALVHYESGMIYSFIPKNACTTLRVSLAVANGCITDLADWTWVHPNNGTFQADLRDLATAPFTFTVLRCPHARLASVFLDKILTHTPEYWKLFRASGDTLTHDSLTFREFVSLVVDDPDMLEADIHWCPQVNFLVYEDYDAWYTVEDFAMATAGIEAQGLPVIDARGLSRHGTDQVSLVQEGCFADTPCRELVEMRRGGFLPAHAALYDDGLATQVAMAYAEDIGLYREHCDATRLSFPHIELQDDDFKRTSP